MRNLILSFLVALSSVGSSYAADKTFTISPSKSKIEWTGKKELVDSKHVGTVPVGKNSMIVMNGNQVKSGVINIDICNLENSDLSGDYKQKLEGHLKSADFFDCAKHKTAMYRLEKAVLVEDADAKNNITYFLNGKLTVKGVTKAHNLKATLVKDSKGMPDMVKTEMCFDRTQYGVMFNAPITFSSALKVAKDKVIANEICTKISLKLESKSAVARK